MACAEPGPVRRRPAPPSAAVRGAPPRRRRRRALRPSSAAAPTRGRSRGAPPPRRARRGESISPPLAPCSAAAAASRRGRWTMSGSRPAAARRTTQSPCCRPARRAPPAPAARRRRRRRRRPPRPTPRPTAVEPSAPLPRAAGVGHAGGAAADGKFGIAVAVEFVEDRVLEMDSEAELAGWCRGWCSAAPAEDGGRGGAAGRSEQFLRGRAATSGHARRRQRLQAFGGRLHGGREAARPVSRH